MASGIRFAPSPTGRFHLGNLRTAWVSQKFAEELKQPWVVRFEDIDAPRVMKGAKDQQLKDLAALGMVPDQVVIQSTLHGEHLRCFEYALKARAVYPCSCSRKQITEALLKMQSAPHSVDFEYPGTCRSKSPEQVLQESQVLGTPVGYRFVDGDFLVGRAEFKATTEETGATFQPSYQWACALDDYFGNYLAIVRGADLIPALTPQRSIQQWLQKSALGLGGIPAALHTRMVAGRKGQRLEKRTQGVTLADCGWSADQVLAQFEKSLDQDWFQKTANALIHASEPGHLIFNEPLGAICLQ